ncbi:DUF6191 domain-containing protein [Streptomyces sp. NBC_00893]|uniref:DUF6191 domain-containing protein n=1 Tax=Streptomyces sp. NBC_00893 TaxID=2975862 RepID=UPI00225AC9BB|nr:DUF6191 domain-containing protein [Streptomyces sp. NBC_00893]MCX4845007.1 DUF6191 domain-containing protein [Streptomyces sp. NBC_00893]
MFNFFEELFAPGRKHASDEQKRLELTRVDLGVGDPGRGPIDLASGKVVVRASGSGGSASADPVADRADRADQADPGSAQDTETDGDGDGARS